MGGFGRVYKRQPSAFIRTKCRNRAGADEHGLIQCLSVANVGVANRPTRRIMAIDSFSMLTKARKSRSLDATQELFPAKAFVGAAMDHMKSASGAKRGAVFTRTEVVDFMLDLIGYTPDRPLWKYRLL